MQGRPLPNHSEWICHKIFYSNGILSRAEIFLFFFNKGRKKVMEEQMLVVKSFVVTGVEEETDPLIQDFMCI